MRLRRKRTDAQPGESATLPIGDDKEIKWLGSSLEDLSAFPVQIRSLVGFALRFAQRGGKHPRAEPLKGYTGAGVLEIIKPFATDTYRAVYTVRFEEKVYVLHAFQKKSNTGAEMPEREMRVIEARLRRAQEMHDDWLRGRKKGRDDDRKR